MTTDSTPRKHISIAVAALELGVQQATVRRWIAQGYLPATRIGRRTIRIARADLDAIGRPINPVRRSA